MQQHAHHVGSLNLFCVLPDDTSRKLMRTIKVCAESVTLARWKVPNISEKKFRDVSPGRLENQIEWRRIQRGIEAVQGQVTTLALLSAANNEVGANKKRKYSQ